jgi:hypothetical protein
MNVPLILFTASGLGMVLLGPDLALLCAVMALVVLARTWLARDIRKVCPQPPLVIDGSNVMYWHGNTPDLDTVRAVVAMVQKAGFLPGVMFDANAGWLLEDRYLHDHDFAKRLGLHPDQVMVVPKGVQADGYILQAARDSGARVVTNDRFRDWAAPYPEVATAGHIIRGGYREGALWLDLASPASPTVARGRGQV